MSSSKDEVEALRKKIEELEKKLMDFEELKEELSRTQERARKYRSYNYGPEANLGEEITTNLVKVIRESISKSLAQIGEDTLGSIIDEMSEEMASAAMRSVSIPDRIKILKILYYSSKSYGEIAREFPQDYAKSSLQHHLQKLRNVKLIEKNDISGEYELTNRGRALLRLMAIFYNALRGGELEES
ncbi:MAG: winged helix-turn-helix domain-containing protein [Thermoproteota archaeon]|nr:winged helix-turn-helix transcriptional regulator [Candidatus Brockarchaeota archaeon]MBO3767916.1 winged helix-turn-helix transcriptional regulator [Candidatus Brockarchaeota archaeon]MBO3801994.1 winged helix-turn-helix transcriptional regulator [Candidatus Brockarchaeota archaeon]